MFYYPGYPRSTVKQNRGYLDFRNVSIMLHITMVSPAPCTRADMTPPSLRTLFQTLTARIPGKAHILFVPQLTLRYLFVEMPYSTHPRPMSKIEHIVFILCSLFNMTLAQYGLQDTQLGNFLYLLYILLHLNYRDSMLE
jgi:hypothetical protein